MTVTDTLFEAAREAMAQCYAPYSKFPVGAAILADDGQVYKIKVHEIPEAAPAARTSRQPE